MAPQEACPAADRPVAPEAAEARPGADPAGCPAGRPEASWAVERLVARQGEHLQAVVGLHRGSQRRNR